MLLLVFVYLPHGLPTPHTGSILIQIFLIFLKINIYYNVKYFSYNKKLLSPI